MNDIARPPMNGQGSPEPMDNLLRGFFRAEMPEPWPTMNRPEPRILPFVRPQRASRFASTRSRLALAASVGLLLVGSWFFSGTLRNNPPGDPSRPNDTAGNKIKPIDPEKRHVDPAVKK
jgi:hypothetical protein